MTTTRNLDLLEMEEGTTEIYLKVNGIHAEIDALVMPNIESIVTAPPSHSEGNVWLIGVGTGDFAGHDDELAISINGAWVYKSPIEGWGNVFNKDTNKPMFYDGSSWSDTLVAGTMKVGDVGGGNYTEIESDGTIVMHGDATVYEDIDISAADFVAPSSGNPDKAEFKDTTGTDTGVECFAYAPGEKVSAVKEIRHSYEEDSNIFFHFHFQIIAAPTGTDKVKAEVGYTFGVEGAAPAAMTTINVEVDVDTQYQFYTATFGAVVGTGINFGDQLMFTFERVAASADEFAGDILISTFGVHIKNDTLGSRTPTTK